MLLTNVRLIDGTGAPPQDNVAILLKDGRIAAIGDPSSFDLPPDTDTLDLAGKTLLPGFIDCHVHILWNPDPNAPVPRLRYLPVKDVAYWKSRALLYGITAAKLTLEAGFTTIQDLGDPNETVIPLRDSLAAGEYPGPRLLTSGAYITHTGGHGVESGGIEWGYHLADGADEMLRVVRQQITAGVDVIKFMSGTRAAMSPPFKGRQGYSEAEMRVGVEEAHRGLLRVAVHAHSSTDGIKNAIRAGADSIEHGFPLDREAADLMAERGTFLCPTLSVNPAAVMAIEQGIWSYPGSEAQVYRMLDYAVESIRIAKAAGVKVALGTDAAMPLVYHGGNAWEFELMTEYGMTAMESLVAGTRNAAENLGLLDQIGTVEVGKIADLVVVDGDPLADIRILRQLDCVPLVFQNGNIVADRRIPAPVQ